MAEVKVNRHNHPILVRARKDAYNAGLGDGYQNGYKKGYEQRCDEIHNYYRIVIKALERKVEVLNTTLKNDSLAYSQGYREGYKAAKEYPIHRRGNATMYGRNIRGG